MTSISYNLSGKVDSSLVEVLQRINRVATALGIRFFVVGAMARIIVLEYCHGIRPARGTRDLDIAVKVDGWNEFHQLAEGLVATGNFAATREPQIFRAGPYRVDGRKHFCLHRNNLLGWLAQLPVSYPGDLVEMGIQGDDFQIVGSGKLGQ